MRRGIFAVLAFVLLVASGLAAGLGYTETAVFEHLHRAGESTGLIDIAGPEAAMIAFQLERDHDEFGLAKGEITRAARHASNEINRPTTHSPSPRKASPLRVAAETPGEASELTTSLMIGVGLISVGLFRRLYRAA